MHVLFLTDDLMFASRVMGVARDLNLEVQMTAPNQSHTLAPDAACRLILTDLTVVGNQIATIVPQVKEIYPTARLICFGPHVDAALLAAAKTAGCDEVWTRGELQRQHISLLTAVAQSIKEQQ